MDRPRYDLSGRVAFISGASAGLGAHLARLYAAAGAAVVLGARRMERTGALATQITAAGGRALAAPLDVTDEASVIAAFDAPKPLSAHRTWWSPTPASGSACDRPMCRRSGCAHWSTPISPGSTSPRAKGRSE